MLRTISGFLGGGAGIVGTGLGAFLTIIPLSAAQKTFALWGLSALTIIALVALAIFFLSERAREKNQEQREQVREEREKRREEEQAKRNRDSDERMNGMNSDIKTLVAALSRSTGTVQAKQTGRAEGYVQYVWWTERQTLREEVADLIRNYRTASKALEIAPEARYTAVLNDVVSPLVGPSIAIRQALRRILGYPKAKTLDHLPPGINPAELETLAEVHERLFDSVPSDAPAVLL